MEFFAIAPPGVEELTRKELAGIGIEGAKCVAGGVEFCGGWPELYRANLLLRTASRILLRIGTFPAVSFPELERKLRRVGWAEWLTAGARVEVSVAARKSRLRHTAKIAGMVEEAIGKAVGDPLTNGVGHLVAVRAERDVFTLSLDTSGEHLHKRGYRTLAGRAPMRENLAAACLMHLDYSGDEPLYDPCCGSGTFPVEAALLALGLPPGLKREFAFEKFLPFRPQMWQAEKEAALANVKKELKAPVFASDLDPEAIRLTVASAREAGVADFVEVAVAPMGELLPPLPTGLLVANPPYGLRLKGGAYGDLRDMLRGDFAAWRWGIVEWRKEGAGRLGIDPGSTMDFSGGGLRLRLLEGGRDERKGEKGGG